MKRSIQGVIPSGSAKLIGGALIGTLLYSSVAFAAGDPLIMEVQPAVDNDPPAIVLYGQYFGDDPMFTYGAYDGMLDTSIDQDLCDEAPPPSLNVDDTIDGFSCVVAALPQIPVDPNFPLGPFFEIPDGDYLIEIWVAGPEECTVKPSSIVFTHDQAAGCGASDNDQEGDYCTGDPTGAPNSLTLVGKKADAWTFDLSAYPDILFTAIKSNNAELEVEIDGAAGDMAIGLHTSCSQPLAVGDVFGNLTVKFIADSAPSMKHDEYDFTLGAVGPEGPQGPQGKLGDTGEQGPQGKLGDTGAQGPQGKLGDTGAQGPQGKLGDTGEQGPQGKLGDTGEQGPQGKLGDTGAQGPQGKLGDTGAQGPQGKLGDTGAQGPQGKLGDTGAQGPQGKLGDTGTQGPQGKLGDTGAQGPQGKLGDTGTQGPQGKLGDTGAQGPQGKLGDTGTQGPQGKLGDTGAQGPQGKLGDTGTQGPQGKLGDTGAQGPQGKLGDTGTQGPQGKLGDTGAQGPQGKLGDTGTQGPQGKLGDTGAQGPQGKLGDTGTQGPQGKLGDTGAQGPQGKLGDTGTQGPQGKLGDTGAQGPQGKLGDTGTQGPQGKLGDTGAQGPQGKLGDTGTQGPQGKLGDTGAQGPQGKLGDTGTQGPQGKLGDTGAQGPQGKLGDTGTQGPQGKLGDTGAQGPQGKDGAPGVPGDTPSVPQCGYDRWVLAFSSDQNIGSNSEKFIGLGDSSGDFNVAAIPVPWDSYAVKILARVDQDFVNVADPNGMIVTVYRSEPGDPAIATSLTCTVNGAAENAEFAYFGCEDDAIVGDGTYFDRGDTISILANNQNGIQADVSVVVGMASGPFIVPTECAEGPLPN